VGAAVAAGLAIILATEAGLPLPIPADVVLLGLGERAGAHAAPLWLVILGLEVVVVAGTCALFVAGRRLGERFLDRLGDRHPSLGAQIERSRRVLDARGSAGLVAGRATPGLRTVSVLVAALSALSSRTALTALLAGSTIFVQGHVLLGYYVGPAARRLLSGLPLLGIGVIALAVGAGIVIWAVRRRGAAGRRGWEEGACPACVAVGVFGRLGEAGPNAPR
jgi:membrane protein DedA with SNARE-associated domain